MKEVIKENKKIIIISILIILILIIGITFAYLITTINGEKEYIVKAKELELKLEEENELTLNNEIPIEDSEGLSRDGFKFSLKNNGKDDYEYTIYLDDIPLEEGENRIPDSAIRYSLDKNETVGVAKDLESMGVNPNRVVDSGEIGSSETINYTLRLWLDYDATNEEAGGKVFKGKLRVEVTMLEGDPVSDTIVDNVGENGSTYDDGTDTFITGTDPNNYIWYSGKLWRAVSINNEAKTTKLVTQWNITSISYGSNAKFSPSFEIYIFLNDATTVDGFLYNLRNYEDFIVTDAKWDASTDNNKLGSIPKPKGKTVVTAPVGLLNTYEFQESYKGTTSYNSYLNNGLSWWFLTPAETFKEYAITDVNSYEEYISVSKEDSSDEGYGVRPAINLKSDIKIASGSGTETDPYRLKGDDDADLNGVKLNTRYSGEYIRFGNGENNLYRIVSHETENLTKITSADPLKEKSKFKAIEFSSGYRFYSDGNTIGSFLNNDYLNPSKKYLTSEQVNMIEDNTTWYLGNMYGTSYIKAKYSDTNMSNLTTSITTAKVGLLRYGELMSGQFDRYENNTEFWTLTADNNSAGGNVFSIDNIGAVTYTGWKLFADLGVKPAMNLKENVVITGGDGTKNNPFTIDLEMGSSN